MSVRIIHLCIDSLFNDFIVEQFRNELSEGYEHVFIIVKEWEGFSFKLNNNVKIVTRSQFAQTIVHENLFWVHSSAGDNKWALDLLKGKKYVFSSWSGGELQHYSRDSAYIFKSLTLKLVTVNDNFISLIKYALISWGGKLFSRLRFVITSKKPKISPKVVTTVIPMEIKLFSKSNRLVYSDFDYAWIDQLVIEEKFNYSNGVNKIMIGHSSVPTMNHLDALHELKGIEAQFLLPLSYGNHEYKDKLLSVLGIHEKKMIYLLEKISLEQYLIELNSCDVVVLFTAVQEAVGNMLSAFYLGKKVVLMRNSVLDYYCETLGLKYFYLDSICSLFTEEDALRNRGIINSNFSKQEVLKRTKKILLRLQS